MFGSCTRFLTPCLFLDEDGRHGLLFLRVGAQSSEHSLQGFSRSVLVRKHTLRSTVILRLAVVVENRANKYPVSKTIKRLFTAKAQSQLLPAAEAPLEEADGVLRAHAKESQLKIVVSAIGGN